MQSLPDLCPGNAISLHVKMVSRRVPDPRLASEDAEQEIYHFPACSHSLLTAAETPTRDSIQYTSFTSRSALILRDVAVLWFFLDCRVGILARVVLSSCPQAPTIHTTATTRLSK
jgi:hypothetical protein